MYSPWQNPDLPLPSPALSSSAVLPPHMAAFAVQSSSSSDRSRSTTPATAVSRLSTPGLALLNIPSAQGLEMSSLSPLTHPDSPSTLPSACGTPVQGQTTQLLPVASEAFAVSERLGGVEARIQGMESQFSSMASNVGSKLDAILTATGRDSKEPCWIMDSYQASTQIPPVTENSPLLATYQKSFPHISTWTPAKYKESCQDDDSAGRGISRKRGPTHRSTGINTTLTYIQKPDGEIANGYETDEIRSICYDLFTDLLSCGRASKQWKSVGHETKEATYYCLEHLFPLLGLCTNHCKAKRLINSIYRKWAIKNVPGAAELADDDDEDPSPPTKRRKAAQGHATPTTSIHPLPQLPTTTSSNQSVNSVTSSRLDLNTIVPLTLPADITASLEENANTAPNSADAVPHRPPSSSVPPTTPATLDDNAAVQVPNAASERSTLSHESTMAADPSQNQRPEVFEPPNIFAHVEIPIPQSVEMNMGDSGAAVPSPASGTQTGAATTSRSLKAYQASPKYRTARNLFLTVYSATVGGTRTEFDAAWSALDPVDLEFYQSLEKELKQNPELALPSANEIENRRKTS
ncbi:hypothetical protein DL96DRAFT_1773942 [Flagelloscypha sp. PMI_526]|nr:hypothetical protein DL96DRAFT_1773942 [Flagelloscypha sp. PMI_526]